MPSTNPPRLRAAGANQVGRAAAIAAASLVFTPAAFGQQQPTAEDFLRSIHERCIRPAAAYHFVDPRVLRAILKVESGLNPQAVNVNGNKSVDRGIGQINSIHFRELATHGVRPEDLHDACIGTYVAAWHLARVMRIGGNTWEGVARYHSASPYCNYRYQVLLRNELVRSRAITGEVLPVPRFRSCGSSS